MLINYLKIAYRNLLKNKTFSLINILGLALAMAACMLILQYVSFELSYDTFPEESDHIFRVTYAYHESNDISYQTALSVPAVGAALEQDFQEVLAFTRLYPYARAQFACAMRYEDGAHPPVSFNEQNLYFADASFLSLFSLPLQQGHPATVLQNPYTAVISATTAKRYFGEANPIGKTLTLNSSSIEQQDFQVTGVMQDIPENSHLQIDILLSMSSLYQHPSFAEFIQSNWTQDDLYTYILLSPETHLQNLKAQLPTFVDKYLGETLRLTQSKVSFDLQPIQAIHLHSDLQNEIKAGNDAKTVYFLTAIALFILILAWINYINLTTAIALERAKEVGVRKVSGASRLQLIKQLLTETLVVNGMSVLLALTIVQLSSTYFHQLSGVPFISHNHPFLWAGVLTLGFTGILISGLFPAFLVSSFRPAQVLKGKFTAAAKGLVLRKSLVVFQFMASVILITGVFTLHQQFTFVQKQDLGIDIHQTLVIKAPAITDDSYLERLGSFKTALQQLAPVRHVSTSSMVPGQENEWRSHVRREREDSRQGKNLAIHVIDTAFMEAYQLHLLAGRNFFASEQPGKRFGEKLESVILNEEAVKQLGYGTMEEAIGSIIYWEDHRCIVVGVVNNFHQQSLKYALQPALFTVNNRDSIYYSVKLHVFPEKQDNHQEAMLTAVGLIGQAWKKFFPENPFDYFFLEDFYNQQYQADLRFGKIFGLFSALAIFIACLGLLGLSSYTAVQRTKEIGIRKVLGASVQSIVTLLSAGFIRLIAVASLLALPLAYWAAQHWLEYYAYSIEIRWWLLCLPIVLVLLIAVITISFQTIKAAIANPAKSLRYE